MDRFTVWSVPDEFAPISMQMRNAPTWPDLIRGLAVSLLVLPVLVASWLLWGRMQWWTGIKFRDLGVALTHTTILQCSKTQSSLLLLFFSFSFWWCDILHQILPSEHLWGGHWHLGTCPMEACSSTTLCSSRRLPCSVQWSSKERPKMLPGETLQPACQQFNDAGLLSICASWCCWDKFTS